MPNSDSAASAALMISLFNLLGMAIALAISYLVIKYAVLHALRRHASEQRSGQGEAAPAGKATAAPTASASRQLDQLRFRVHGVNLSGAEMSVTIDAPDRATAIQKAKQQGIKVTDARLSEAGA